MFPDIVDCTADGLPHFVGGYWEAQRSASGLLATRAHGFWGSGLTLSSVFIPISEFLSY